LACSDFGVVPIAMKSTFDRSVVVAWRVRAT
jgi:hypothetical protein